MADERIPDLTALAGANLANDDEHVVNDTSVPLTKKMTTAELITGLKTLGSLAVGPASATDNALAVFDSTTGKLIKNSVAILSGAGALSGLISAAIATGTITASTPALAITQTLNSSGVTFKTATITVTDTASAAASVYFEIIRDSTRLFAIRPATISATKYNRTVLSMAQFVYTEIAAGGGFNIGTDESNVGVVLYSSVGAGVEVASGARYRWSDSAGNVPAGSSDTGLGRNAAGVVEVNNGTNGTYRDLRARNVRTNATTVAGLTAAATAGAGARSFVTDANATTFLSTVAGGGANAVPVVSDGTNWLIG